MAAAVDDTAAREIVIVRTVNAPRLLVWQAWTRPEHIAAWWGPNGFRTTIHEMDFKVGGVWRFIMHGPDGTDYPNRVVYREIVEPQRLVYDHAEDTPNPAIRFQATITFEEVPPGHTKVTLRSLFPTAAARAAVAGFAVAGGEQTLARLDAHLAAMRPGA
jgi:uncharacterized protein YndB with AHSA1/START domain